MDITPLVPEGRQIIEGYGNGGFRIGGTVHAGSILVFPDRSESWPVASFEAMTLAALAPVIEAGRSGAVELLLLGCGNRLAPVPPPIRAALKEAGVAVEPMDTGAACRTYNVLMAEGRRVAAALIAVASAS